MALDLSTRRQARFESMDYEGGGPGSPMKMSSPLKSPSSRARTVRFSDVYSSGQTYCTRRANKVQAKEAATAKASNEPGTRMQTRSQNNKSTSRGILTSPKPLGSPLPDCQVPTDPRLWTAADVQAWLHHMKVAHKLSDASLFERFPMNGKALCLMDASMFVYRVPNGGETLFKDFRSRLSRAVALATLNQEECMSP